MESSAGAMGQKAAKMGSQEGNARGGIPSPLDSQTRNARDAAAQRPEIQSPKERVGNFARVMGPVKNKLEPHVQNILGIHEARPATRYPRKVK